MARTLLSVLGLRLGGWRLLEHCRRCAGRVRGAEDVVADWPSDVEVPLAHERLTVVHLVVMAQVGHSRQRAQPAVRRGVVRQMHPLVRH